MGKTFFEDLEKGKGAELYILDQLKNEFPTMVKVEEKCINYDLIDDNGYTVEVKLDTRSKDTGNVAIEIRHRGIPAGISISKAMEWAVVYYLKYYGWVYSRTKPDNIRRFIKRNIEFLRVYENPDDLDKSQIVLIDTIDFANEFNYYKILDTYAPMV